MHDECDGNLYYLNVMGLKFVVSFNPDHVPIMVRAAGPTPGPLQILPWIFRESEKAKADPKYEANLIALEGQKWRENRTVLDAVFSSIPRIQSYLPMVDAIAEDFSKNLLKNLDAKGESPDLYNNLYCYSNEVIGEIVYGMRLGNMEAQRTPLMQEFGKDLVDLFQTMAELQMSVPFYWYVKTPRYRHFLNLLEKFETYYSPKLLADSDNYHQQHDTKARIDLVAHMRQMGQNQDRILVNAITMFLAGSDSTTHTLMWLLYNLGRFPDAQEKLRQEVAAVLPNKAPATVEALHSLKYVRAVLKESMRITPSSPGIVRMYDHPIALGGYEIPAGVLISNLSVITSKKPSVYHDPELFIPERFMEVDRAKRPNPWAHVPFGSGPRACQAFRLAELESYLLMVKLVQNYKWETLNTVESRSDLFMKPDREVHFRWTPI